MNYLPVWFYVRFLYDNLALTAQRNALSIKTDHWTTRAFAHAHAQEKLNQFRPHLAAFAQHLKREEQKSSQYCYSFFIFL